MAFGHVLVIEAEGDLLAKHDLAILRVGGQDHDALQVVHHRFDGLVHRGKAGAMYAVTEGEMVLVVACGQGDGVGVGDTETIVGAIARHVMGNAVDDHLGRTRHVALSVSVHHREGAEREGVAIRGLQECQGESWCRRGRVHRGAFEVDGTPGRRVRDAQLGLPVGEDETESVVPHGERGLMVISEPLGVRAIVVRLQVVGQVVDDDLGLHRAVVVIVPVAYLISEGGGGVARLGGHSGVGELGKVVDGTGTMLLHVSGLDDLLGGTC